MLTSSMRVAASDSSEVRDQILALKSSAYASGIPAQIPSRFSATLAKNEAVVTVSFQPIIGPAFRSRHQVHISMPCASSANDARLGQPNSDHADGNPHLHFPCLMFAHGSSTKLGKK
jgi:hypothetical protein